MSELNLLETEDESDLRRTVRDFLAARLSPVSVLDLYDGDRSAVAPLWQGLARDVGLVGLLIPESEGGAGASAREAAVVCEELGRAVAPVPFLTSAVVAVSAVQGSGHELVHKLASGNITAALAVPFTTAPDDGIRPLAMNAGAVTGRITSVAGALESDVFIVPVLIDDGRQSMALAAVEASEAQVNAVASLDMSRQLADLQFEAAAGTLIPGSGRDDVRRALEIGVAMLSAEQVGVASWCLDRSLQYVRERRQFGRPVGSFQVIKHRLADLYVGVETATAAARYAAAALAAQDSDAPIATRVAASFCGDLAVTAAEEMLQLHGGIGMTWEHPVHLYLKRAKADQIALGRPGLHRGRLAELVDLPVESGMP